MDDIYSLLNIDRRAFASFALLGTQVSNLHIEGVIKNQISNLERLAERTRDNGPKPVAQSAVDAILRRVLTLAEEDAGTEERWRIRDLSTLCYYLKRLRNHPRGLDYVLAVLEKNWRNLFMNGIVSSLLSSWNETEPEYRSRLCLFLQTKLEQYNGHSRRYNTLKDHADWFDESGPMRMAALLIARGRELTEAPALLGYKSATIRQSYYSDVILQYIRRKAIADTTYIESILKLHPLDRTKKLLIVSMVEKAEQEGDAMKQAMLCAFINRTLGKVEYLETWAPFPGATPDEAQRLRRAMTLVRTWLTRKVIEVFFEECIQDPDRRDFWLRYISHVSRFKIVGSRATYIRLMNNSSIADVLKSYFIILAQGTRAQTSALVLSIRDKVIAEFSDSGAVYVYDRNDAVAYNVFNRQFVSIINDLKRPQMGSLVDISPWGFCDCNQTGRLVHRGEWQYRLNLWMNRVALQGGSEDVSQALKANDLFVETPLDKEEEIPPSV